MRVDLYGEWCVVFAQTCHLCEMRSRFNSHYFLRLPLLAGKSVEEGGGGVGSE